MTEAPVPPRPDDAPGPGSPVSGAPLPAAGGASARPGLPLSAGRLFPLLLRSLFLQASWSFERMQTVGFAFLVAGEGRRLAPGPAAAPFLARHLGFFNTNPPMASFIAGAVVRMEEEVAAGRLAPAEVERFKRGVVGPFAAWGDTLFWATLRPAATAAGVLVGWLAGAWGALAYLIVYNALHLSIRIRGLRQGYRWGRLVAERVSSSGIRHWPARIQPFGLAAIGLLAGLSLAGGWSQSGPVGALLLATALVVAFVGLKRTARLGDAWGLAPIALGFVYLLLKGGR